MGLLRRRQRRCHRLGCGNYTEPGTGWLCRMHFDQVTPHR